MRKEKKRIQGLDYMLHKDTFEDTSKIRKLYWKDNMDKIVNYFMINKEKIKLEKLRFY